MCPAQDVKNDEPGCSSGQQSLAIESLVAASMAVCESMINLTHAVHELVRQNGLLLQALAEGEPDPEAEPQTYLSGRPRR